jgi:RNA-binding protein
MKTVKLSSRGRQHLRGLANELRPIVQVGTGGVTESVVAAVNAALEDHELVKIKVGKGVSDEREATGAELATACGAELCQVIGRTIVLFRPRDRDLPGRPRIEVPD